MRTVGRQAKLWLAFSAIIALSLGWSAQIVAEDVLVTTSQAKLVGTLLETGLVIDLDAGGVAQFPLPLITTVTSTAGKSKVKLSNGDLVSGQLRDVMLHFRTSSSDLTIPVEKIASLTLGERAAAPESGEAQLITLRNGDSFGWLLEPNGRTVVVLETSFSDPLRLQLVQLAELAVNPDGTAVAVMRNGDMIKGKMSSAIFKAQTQFGVLGLAAGDLQSLRYLTKQDNEARRVGKPAVQSAPAQPVQPAQPVVKPQDAPAAQAVQTAAPPAPPAALELRRPHLAIRGRIPDEGRAFLNYTWSSAGKLATVVGIPTGNAKTQYDLFIYDVSQKQYSTVTSDGNSTFPAWSPDGRTLAWDYRPAGAKTSEIWLADADGKNRRQLTKRNSGGYADLAWSPNGARLAFVYSDNVTGVEGLCVINSDGSGFDTLATSATETFYHLRWSPDSKKLLYTAGVLGAKPYSAVQVMDVATKNARVLVPSDKKWVNDAAEWSPDGKQIVFASNRTGSRRILRMAAEGGEPVLLPGSEYDDVPVWAPGGKDIVYLATKGGQRQIMALDPTTPRTWPLTIEGRVIGGPQVSPDGRYLAFVRVDRVPELWVTSLSD